MEAAGVPRRRTFGEDENGERTISVGGGKGYEDWGGCRGRRGGDQGWGRERRRRGGLTWWGLKYSQPHDLLGQLRSAFYRCWTSTYTYIVGVGSF